MGATDLDQDGDVDIVIVDNFNSKISWFENDGNYNYTENLIEDRDRTYPTAIMPVDLDKDDDIDRLVAEEGLYPSYDGSVVWFENDGSQHFTSHYIDPDYRGPNSLDLADLDHDGDWNDDYPVGSAIDPVGPDSGVERINRGGAFNYAAAYCRSGNRWYDEPHSEISSLPTNN